MLDIGHVAKQIAEARREMGFTQEELAVRLGITAQAVSKWERAVSLPDTEMLIDLARILNISLLKLLGVEEDVPEPAIQAAAPGNPQTFSDLQLFDPLVIQLGHGLIPLVDVHSGGKLLNDIVSLRRICYMCTGVMLPAIRVMDSEELEQFSARITIFDTTQYEESFGEIIDETGEAVKRFLHRCVRDNLPRFLTRHSVKLELEKLRDKYPFTVEGVVPERITLSQLKTLCKQLVGDGYSILNLYAILETVDDALEAGKAIAEVPEVLKTMLPTHQF